MLTDEQKKQNHQRFLRAVATAKKILKRGDRIRATKCPGTKRWFIFERWDGNWIVSKSGIDDIAACCIDRVNSKIVDFGA